MPRTVFVGIDRGRVFRGAVTRRKMASLAGLPYREFCETFDWMNLYGEEPAPLFTSKSEEAEEDIRRARELIPDLARYDRMVLLGGRVAKAFGCAHVPLHEWTTISTSPPLSRSADAPYESAELEHAGAR